MIADMVVQNKHMLQALRLLTVYQTMTSFAVMVSYKLVRILYLCLVTYSTEITCRNTLTSILQVIMSRDKQVAYSTGLSGWRSLGYFPQEKC